MNTSKKYTVLVIDDHPLFRKGVTQLFESENDFEIIGESACGSDGIELARQVKPDLILLDLNMKGMDGIQVLKAIKKSDDIDSLVIMLTVSDAEADLVSAIKCGADGYLLKDSEPEDLVEMIRTAATGKVVLNEHLTGMLTRAMRNDSPVSYHDDTQLTDRENEILGLIAEGLSNKRIARALGISDGTVKVHVKNLLRKLNLGSRLEAAVWALEYKHR